MDVLSQRSKKLSVHVGAIKPCVFSRSTKNTVGTGNPIEPIVLEKSHVSITASDVPPTQKSAYRLKQQT